MVRIKSIRTKVLDQIVGKYHGLKAVVKGDLCQIICNNPGIQSCNNPGIQSCNNLGIQSCINHGIRFCDNHGLQAVVIDPWKMWALALIFIYNLKI